MQKPFPTSTQRLSYTSTCLFSWWKQVWVYSAAGLRLSQYGRLRAAFTVKALRKRLGSGARPEIDGQHDLISPRIAIEPCRLVAVAIKPSPHRDHVARKIDRVHSNCHGLHLLPLMYPLLSRGAPRAGGIV